MSDQTDGGTDVLLTYADGAKELNSQVLEGEIERIWSEKMRSEQGRAEIAHALGVKANELSATAGSPLKSEPEASGFLGVDLIVAAHWAAINIGIPVLVGLAKDEVKARLIQLWRQVFKPEIDGDGGESRLGEERKPVD